MSHQQEQLLVLVNEQDEPVGTMEKMETHRKALLHRAFSVFLFNSKGEMMLQRRALHKYHSGGLWTNACCSHPFPAETPEVGAKRRLHEELGFVTEITSAFTFIYKAELDNELTEYEYDHVFIGTYDGAVYINEDEVGDYCFRSMYDLKNDVDQHPGQYTEWFKIALPLLENYLKENRQQVHA
jgi:isopentenyl-diphosphate delta-isomerase